MVTSTATRDGAPLPDGACETGLQTIPLLQERSFSGWQTDIPAGYLKLDVTELPARINTARHAMSGRAVILGHHYQREDIIQFADVRGDSFKLAQWASEQ